MVRRVDPDELDPEPPERVEGDVERKEAGRARMEAPLDHVDEHERGEEVPQRLVEERRVVGRLIERAQRPVGRVDLEAPGQVRGLTEELLVPPVADPPYGLGDEQAGREAVGEQPHVGACALRDIPTHEAAGRDATPHAEAALPDRERPPPLVGHLVPARREVVEAGADDAGADAPDGTAEDEIPVATAVDEPVAGDPDADGDRREQREAVHVDRERADVDGAARRRRDRGEKVHGGENHG